MQPSDFERLGALYLGQPMNESTPLIYDSKALNTHALIVGMTGSGKTGLGAVMLEEAAIDGIPAIVVDPKGDLGSLLLTFPDLSPSSFAPWVPPGEDPASVAERHRRGLAEWGQDGARIDRFASSVERVLYTPGSSAGRPLSVMPSLAPPPTRDVDTLRDRAVRTASAFLALAGLPVDPRAPDHSLLSTVLFEAWRADRTLDVASMLRELQSPPFTRIGAMDLEAVVPAKARAQLAVQINAVLASPSMQGFLDGPPLDIASLLYGPGGRPRLSILSIAHLSDQDRQFFVTSLLGELLAWMRAQPGTSSLRALFYMDEIAGYFPPVANPPPKAPMLTLLKQARAFGLGIVLATQNPVDLDYKGLSNTGTWMLGRLQTDRDKLRVLDGLEGASSESGRSFDRKALDAQLSGMAPRTFLLQSIHLPAPVHFKVRYALSYLRGPLSRDELARLMAGTGSPERPSLVPAMTAPAGIAPGAALATPNAASDPAASTRPVLPPDVSETFLVRSDLSGPQVYRAGALAEATLRFADAKAGIESTQKLTLIAPLRDEQPRWEEAWTYSGADPSLSPQPNAALSFGPLPSLAMRASTWKKWERAAMQHCSAERALSVLAAPELKLSGRAGEGRDAFASRVALAARERRDEEVGKLSAKWEPKIQRARDDIEKFKRKIEDASGDRTSAVAASGLEIGASVLGAMFGSRRSVLRSASSVATKARRAQRSAANKERAEADLREAEAQCRTMEDDLRSALEELRASWDPSNVDIVERKLLPKKADVTLSRVCLVWVPVAS
jgi:hypothetical protein